MEVCVPTHISLSHYGQPRGHISEHQHEKISTVTAIRAAWVRGAPAYIRHCLYGLPRGYPRNHLRWHPREYPRRAFMHASGVSGPRYARESFRIKISSTFYLWAFSPCTITGTFLRTFMRKRLRCKWYVACTMLSHRRRKSDWYDTQHVHKLYVNSSIRLPREAKQRRPVLRTKKIKVRHVGKRYDKDFGIFAFPYRNETADVTGISSNSAIGVGCHSTLSASLSLKNKDGQ